MSKQTVQALCDAHQLAPAEVARRTGLDLRRVLAIIEGRWLPAPDERDQIAGLFGLSREEVAWGHKSEVAHLQGHGPQFGRSP